MPLGAQSGQSLRPVSHRPLTNCTLSRSCHVLNRHQRHPCPVQTNRLQPLQFMHITCLRFRFSKLPDLLFGELELSFCHSPMLLHLVVFSEVHALPHMRKFHSP